MFPVLMTYYSPSSGNLSRVLHRQKPRFPSWKTRPAWSELKSGHRVFRFRCGTGCLQRHARFENSHVVVTVAFAAHLPPSGHSQHIVHQVLGEFPQPLAVQKLTSVEINPSVLMGRQMAVAGDLYRGHRRGERRAASRRKQHDLRARGGQRRGGHQIVAGR